MTNLLTPIHRTNGAISIAQPRCETMTVTPEIAIEWLRGNTRNRPIDKHHLARLCRDQRAGKWLFNPQPISFAADHSILDGQHRLTMVVETGIPATFVVWFNVPTGTREAMDLGKPRDLSDVIGISKVEAAVTHAMMRGGATSWIAPTMNEKAAFHRRFGTEIQFAMRVFPSTKTGLKKACIPAAIARAACGYVPHDVLESFARILISGMPDKITDSTVIRLRDKLLAIGGNTGTSAAVETYLTIESAIRAYQQGKALSKIYPAKSELFPLPVAEEDGE